MPWWEIALITYAALTPLSEIVTIAAIMLLLDEIRHRRTVK